MICMNEEHRRQVLLLADDDQGAAALVAEYLRQEGFHLIVEPQLPRVVLRVRQKAPDVVVLGMSSAGHDVFSVCRQVRSEFSGPLLLLTAGSDEAEEIVGLDSGADDCLAKPVRLGSLLARIRAQLRKQQGASPVTDICVGGLHISHRRRSVSIGGCPVELTKGEFDLLWFLVQHIDTVVSRSQLYESLLGIRYDGTDRSLDLRVSRLRRKLGEEASRLVRIRSIRAVGYMLSVD